MQMMGQYQGFHSVARHENPGRLGRHEGSQSIELTRVIEGRAHNLTRMTSRQQRRAIRRKAIRRKPKTSGLRWQV
mgnify:FL=1